MGKKQNLKNNPFYDSIDEKHHPIIFCRDCNIKMKYVGKKIPTVEMEAPLIAYMCPSCKKARAERFYYVGFDIGKLGNTYW